MRRHFQPPAERQALDEAMAQALAVTIAWLTSDKDQADHLATLLGAWLQREAVAEQLYRLIEPTPDQELDLPLLTAEFIAAGWEPTLLSDRHRFDQIVATPATAFTNAAAQQPLLQGAIQIGGAELYELFVNQLLYEWERQKQDLRGQPTSLEALLQAANVDTGRLTRALNELAYRVHSQAASSNAQNDTQRDTVDIPVSLLEGVLKPLHPGLRGDKAKWAAEVLELIADRSGLINAIDATAGAELYKFSHRTFQECLAARWLATGPTEEKLVKFKSHLRQEGWREALLLGIGYRVAAPLNNYADALLVIDELLPAAVNDTETARQFVLLGEAYARQLGPQRAQEAGNRKVATRVADQLPPLLLTTMQHHELPPRLRLEAGLLLDDLGHLPADLEDLVTINAARTLGSKFKIGKYPVTNHQYRRFVEAGGYGDEQW